MTCFLTYIVDKLWPTFIAVIVTQIVTQKIIEMRKPMLEMVPEGRQPWSLKRWAQDGSLLAELPYHMWRIKVEHVKIPRLLSRLIRSREAALQCKANLTFYTADDQALFTMQGRWANTPEISLISSVSQQEKITYPDTISIGYHLSEPLDCIVKFGNDNVAFAWNNEAYAATDNKNPRYKLSVGTYKVDVRLSGQNFKQITIKFNLVIAGDWHGTTLTLADPNSSN